MQSICCRLDTPLLAVSRFSLDIATAMPVDFLNYFHLKTIFYKLNDLFLSG